MSPYRRRVRIFVTEHIAETNPFGLCVASALVKDIIPQARKDPDIVRHKGLKVLTPDGTEVDPRAANWSAEDFPYWMAWTRARA